LESVESEESVESVESVGSGVTDRHLTVGREDKWGKGRLEE
jgi:hypothetical protein